MSFRSGWRNSVRVGIGATIVLAGSVTGSAWAEVRYVRQGAPPGGDGLSWATAWNDLGPGLASVFGNFSVTEVWVATGTYYPTQVFDFGARDKSFMLRKDLAVLGGFDGTETIAAERDPALNLTVLSGDLGVPGVATDNALHVVRTDFSTAFSGLTAVLDGFTIKGGYANVNFSNVGGGILADGSGTFRRCVIRENFATVSGGGVWAQRATVFESCTFESNSNGGSGGAAVQFEGNGAPLTFTACDFVGNSGNTGAVRCQQATFTDCLFEGNTGPSAGAITWYGNNAQHLVIRNSTIRDNTSASNAGAILAISGGVLSISESAFIHNVATSDGAGAIYRSSPNSADRIHLTRFLGNVGAGSAGGGALRNGEIEFVSCEFSGNQAVNGGAIASQSTRPIVNCTFSKNVATSGAGAIHAVNANVQLSNCILWNNLGAGGGTQSSQLVCGPAPTIRRSTIQFWNGSFGGVGNNGTDPALFEPLGPDGLAGTDDDDLRLTAASPAIDSADPTWLPADALDVDGDADIVEKVPLDADGSARLFDDPATADSGAGVPTYLDRGAQEFDPSEFSSAIAYVGPQGGSWFNPANWSGGVLPGPRAGVVISKSVVLSGGVATVGSLEVGSGGQLNVSKGELFVETLNLVSGGSVFLGRGGVVDVGSCVVDGASGLSWTGGEMRLHGSLDREAPLSVQNGSLVLIDGTVNAPLVTLAEAASLRGVGSVSGGLVNAGTVEIGGVTATGTSISIGEAFTQTPTGTLRVPLSGFGAAANPARLVAPQAFVDGGIVAIAGRELAADVYADHVVVAANELSGTFLSVELPPAPAGFSYEVVYGTDELRLRSRLIESGPRLYVRVDATPGGDGQSWATAAASLHNVMLAAASLDGTASDIDEIWVAAGIHRPIDDAPDAADGYSIPSGVTIYGGFDGSETSLEERDTLANATILSGDLLGNDVRSPKNPALEPSRVDNAGPLLVAQGLTTPSTLDGLILTDGYQGPQGGGLEIYDSEITIIDCTFTDNAASAAGGIVSRGASTLQILDSRFVDNWGGIGCDVRVMDGTVATIESSLFDGSRDANGFPSVVDLTSGSGLVTITGCEFLGSVHAGAIQSDRPLLLRDSYVYGYVGIGLRATSTTRVERCSFAGPDGAGISLGQNASLEMIHTTVEGFSNGPGYALVADDASTVHAVNCIVRGGYSATGAAIRLDHADAIFDGCLIFSNASDIANGGAISADDTALTLRYCTIFANRADTGGGVSCTGALQSSLTVDRSIVWMNLNGHVPSFESQLDLGPLGPRAIAVNGSIIQFVPAHLGVGNLDLDPLFVDPVGPDLLEGTGDENCELQSASPAVNAAPASSLPPDALDVDADGDTLESLPLDVLSHVRLRGGAADLGAIERFEPADLDDNGTVDGSDLAILLGAWGTAAADLTGDGVTGGADLAILLGAWGI